MERNAGDNTQWVYGNTRPNIAGEPILCASCATENPSVDCPCQAPQETNICRSARGNCEESSNPVNPLTQTGPQENEPQTLPAHARNTSHENCYCPLANGQGVSQSIPVNSLEEYINSMIGEPVTLQLHTGKGDQEMEGTLLGSENGYLLLQEMNGKKHIIALETLHTMNTQK